MAFGSRASAIILASACLAATGCRERGLEAELRRFPERTPVATTSLSGSADGWLARSIETNPQRVVAPPR